MARFAVFTATLDKAGNRLATVDYATVAGSAVAGDDFTETTGTLTFEIGEVSKTIEVPIRDNIFGEPAKSFSVLLSNPVNCTLANEYNGATIPAGGDVPVVVINGPMIKAGLITNAFHNEMGRGGYFHAFSGTSEGQSIAIEGSLLAGRLLASGTPEEQAAATWYTNMGKTMLDAMGDGSSTGTMLRQPVPTDPNVITLLHWLYAARGDVPSQGINYDYSTRRLGNKLIIPVIVPGGHKGAADVFRVWMIYPKSSYLLYYSPYSPTFNTTTPGEDTSIRLDDGFAGPLATPSPHWTLNAGQVEVTIPEDAPSDLDWYVVYAYNNAPTIYQGQAMEAYPIWTGIPDGYSACAPDTFRWFNHALKLAVEEDDREGMAVHWENLRLASNRTAVRGQTISDLREVIKPLPQFPVIPVSGEPSGMFCYSNHPQATPPPAEIIAAGGNAEWIGYNFLSRVGGSGGEVTPGDFTWTPDNMSDSASWVGHDIYNGAIRIQAPALPHEYLQNNSQATIRQSFAAQIQIGRGLNGEWRTATAWQDPDQYMFVAIQVNKVLQTQAQDIFHGSADTPSGTLTTRVPKDNLYVFVSSTKAYNGSTRWYANLTDLSFTNAGGGYPGPALRYYLVPRSAFVRKDSDNAVLPAGTRFENFGLSIEVAGNIDMNLIAMRLVSGATAAAVTANMAKAVRGSVMPFFPGAMPFAINADITKQQFVGWNGSPFHGYQLPDLWYFLADDADAILGSLTAATLPVASASGAITYPITANTTGSTAKPKHALLMEQQLRFLQAAQTKYSSDGGPMGPFAHTFVLNTPARMTLGNPQPHSWVYINDDPNTRWCGYQARVVESLSRTVYLTRADAGFLDCRNLSLDMAMKWLESHNTLWPNLNGIPNPKAGATPSTLFGAPTDYPDPRISAPQTLYEEPHAPALILRACVWLKASGILSAPQLAIINAVGKRCFDYLEMRWRDEETDSMRYTWSNIDGDNTEQYYGFWVFEVIATLCYMLETTDGLIEDVDPVRAREFVALHQLWLAQHTEA